MDENNEGIEPMQVIGEGDEGEDEETTSENEAVERPIRRSTTRRFGDALIQAFRHPLRLASRSDAARLYQLTWNRREQELINDDDDSIPENADFFDTELPAVHSYLGNLARVSGVDYLEPGKFYRLLIFMHHSMIFPGETLPMIIPDYMFDRTLFPEEGQGLMFGVVFPSMWKSTKPNLYGVTCQIYEKGNDESGNVSILSRAHQRFMISKKHNSNFSEFLRPNERKIYANVRILPEIVLPDPLSAIDMGSLNRFRDISSMSDKLRFMQSATTIWPIFVYNQYDIKSTIERAKKSLTEYKIDSMPTDHVLLSFWLGQNLLFDTKERMKLFLTDSVNIRMQIIEKSLDNEKYFCCSRCKSQIANCNALFAMSKHGVQSNYCNPSGFIHETNTVYAVKQGAVYPSGDPSSEFSWFPGYAWQIILCRLCDIHIGWIFIASKPNLVPKKFFGLSGINIKVDIPDAAESDNADQHISEESREQDHLLLYEASENNGIY